MWHAGEVLLQSKLRMLLGLLSLKETYFGNCN